MALRQGPRGGGLDAHYSGREISMNSTRLCLAVLCVVLVSGLAGAVGAGNWPQFRGPDAQGVLDGAGLPDTWSATENVAWKTDVPGRGWSSPIVWGERVFVTTAVNLGESKEAKKGLYFGGEQKDAPQSAHQWKVLCLSLTDGKVLWERQVHEGVPSQPIHIKNSYASETPVTDGKYVYAYFGNVGVYCLDFDGNVVWEKAIEPHKMNMGWGKASSPALHGGRLYIQNDNSEDSHLLALDAATGNEIWRVPREEKGNWSTPFVWMNEKRTEIVTAGTRMVRSYDLDGKVLWSLKRMSGITIATPYAADGLVYVSSGYIISKDRPIYAIRPGASGDISLAPGAKSNEWIAWSDPFEAPYNPSTLVYGGRLYSLDDGGRVTCFNAADGSRLYKKEHIPESRTFTTSPWGADGKVFCLNEDGVTYVLKDGDTFEFLHSNPLAEDDMCLATPALAGDRLLIRSAVRLYCIRKSAAQ
jgi:outer membrane protein assembly factor BamB